MVLTAVYVVFLALLVIDLIDEDKILNKIIYSLLCLICITSVCLIILQPKLKIDDERLESLLDDRTEIISCINEDLVSINDLTAIKEYNKCVNDGNNYICRWVLEDRSYYEIDYDYYHNLYCNQNPERIYIEIR